MTDASLVAAVRAGDDRAFERLYGRYSRRIAAYVLGMVKDHARAEDITQDAFMSALRRMRGTDCPITFKPWIYEIAKNACIDQFRRQRRAEEVSFDAEGGLGSADYGRLATSDAAPDAALAAKQQLDDLCGAIGGLSDAHHQILVLREFEGLSYREIGERLGMTRPSVESTLFRARKRLTEEYDELATGRRCVRVQGMVTGGTCDELGARERRRVARHLSCCPPCRRHAIAAGAGHLVGEARPGLAGRIAALLPLPALLRGRFGVAVSSAPFEPAAGWAKIAVAAGTVALAGAGVGALTRPQHAPAATARPAAAGARLVPRAQPLPVPVVSASQEGSARRPAASRVRAPRRSRPAVRATAPATTRRAAAGAEPHAFAPAGTTPSAVSPAAAGTTLPAASSLVTAPSPASAPLPPPPAAAQGVLDAAGAAAQGVARVVAGAVTPPAGSPVDAVGVPSGAGGG